MKYISPKINIKSFTCPYCNTLAQQEWENIKIDVTANSHYFTESKYPTVVDELSISTCKSCGKYHLWFNEEMIIPDVTSVPLPNEDMPEDIKCIYLEARSILNKSPKASAALLRLALQKLCKFMGGEGININSDIAKFVKEGLDIRIQKSLDIVRITGNNAVHPGTIVFDDNPEIASRLFGLINIIVESMITQPKLIDSFFDEMPEGAKKSIERRDKGE